MESQREHARVLEATLKACVNLEKRREGCLLTLAAENEKNKQKSLVEQSAEMAFSRAERLRDQVLLMIH